MALEDYPRPSVAVDLVIVRSVADEPQVLLIRRGAPPYEGQWALPGGFVDIDESLDDAASRELYEETGLSSIYTEQLHTFGDIDRDPRGRVISLAYVAVVPADIDGLRAGDDAAAVQWWPLHNLPALAFDHVDILSYAERHLRYRPREVSSEEKQ